MNQILHVCDDGEREDVSEKVSVGFKFCCWCGERYQEVVETMKNIPDKIYLVTGEGPDHDNFDSCDCVTWSKERKNPEDLCYVISSDTQKAKGAIDLLTKDKSWTVIKHIGPMTERNLLNWFNSKSNNH